MDMVCSYFSYQQSIHYLVIVLPHFQFNDKFHRTNLTSHKMLTLPIRNFENSTMIIQGVFHCMYIHFTYIYVLCGLSGEKYFLVEYFVVCIFTIHVYIIIYYEIVKSLILYYITLVCRRQWGVQNDVGIILEILLLLLFGILEQF